MNMPTCPKCAYTRTAQDQGSIEECPRCGVIYAKAKPRNNPLPQTDDTGAETVLVPQSRPVAAKPQTHGSDAHAEPKAAPQHPSPSAPGTPSPAPRRNKNTTSLIECPDCGQMISPSARACPHCGAPGQDADRSMPVDIHDIDMPFLSMVKLLIKWALASIPAAIIFFFCCMMIVLCLGAVFSGIGGIMVGFLRAFH